MDDFEDLERSIEAYEEIGAKIRQKQEELSQLVKKKLSLDGAEKTFQSLYNINPSFKEFYEFNKDSMHHYITVMRNFLLGDKIRTTYKKEKVVGVVIEKKMDPHNPYVIIKTDEPVDETGDDILHCPVPGVRDPLYFAHEPETGDEMYKEQSRPETKEELILQWLSVETLPF